MSEQKKYKIEFNGLENAQKNMQEIVDKLPKLKDNLPDFEDYGEKIKLTKKNFHDWESAIIAHFYEYRNEVEEGYSQIGIATAEVASKVELLNGLNQKVLKTMIESNKVKLESADAEIESTKKLSTSVSDIIKVYDKKKEVIKEQAQISIAVVNEEYNRHIASAKKAGADITQLETDKTERIRLINKKLETDITKTVQEEFDARKAVLDAHQKEVLDETKKLGVSQLKHYKQSLEYAEKVEIDHYKKLDKEYRGDKEKLAVIQEEKKKVLEYYANEKKKIGESINEVEEKQSKEQLEKWKKSAEEFKKVADDIKNGTDAVGGEIEKMFKAQVDNIDNQVKEIDTRQKAIIEEKKVFSDRLAELQKKEADTSISLTQNEKAELQNLSSLDKKLNDENTKLQEDKIKKNKEREKVEKLRRKGELVKQIGEATASVALSVTKALATGPFIGQILAGISAAAGAIQIGIMTKQLAKFEDGGLLRGRRHSQGGMRIEGTNIEVEGGEYVVNRESTRKNVELLGYINKQRKELKPHDIRSFFAMPPSSFSMPFAREFAAGGTLPPMTLSTNLENAALVDAIKSMKFEPKVAVTDIIRVQDEMTQVGGWTGV